MIRLTQQQIDMPENYFDLSMEDRLDVCVGLLETIYTIIIKNSSEQLNKVELFHRVLDATIEYNEKIENYELCGLLNDTKKLLDESTRKSVDSQ